MLPETSTDDYLRINEIKNFIYCPRIPFYALCMHLDRETALSQMGIENESTTKQRMKRRKHALHAVHDGQRHLEVPVVHHDLRLVGRVDEVIESAAGLYIVDYKDTDQDYGYWKIQMQAYRACLEAAGYTVLGCYVYSIPDQTYHAVKPTARDSAQLHEILEKLNAMIERSVIPEPTPHHRKCQTCQYERFCNDVL
jgi:CRISPR-associated exonuclease Cas4